MRWVANTESSVMSSEEGGGAIMTTASAGKSNVTWSTMNSPGISAPSCQLDLSWAWCSSAGSCPTPWTRRHSARTAPCPTSWRSGSSWVLGSTWSGCSWSYSWRRVRWDPACPCLTLDARTLRLARTCSCRWASWSPTGTGFRDNCEQNVRPCRCRRRAEWPCRRVPLDWRQTVARSVTDSRRSCGFVRDRVSSVGPRSPARSIERASWRVYWSRLRAYVPALVARRSALSQTQHDDNFTLPLPQSLYGPFVA